MLDDMMLDVIVTSDAEYRVALDRMATKGYKPAAVSNTGLQDGNWRITFLKAEFFSDDPSAGGDVMAPMEQKSIEDFVNGL